MKSVPKPNPVDQILPMNDEADKRHALEVDSEISQQQHDFIADYLT